MEEDQPIPSRLPTRTIPRGRMMGNGIQLPAGEKPTVNMLFVAWRRRWAVLGCVAVALAIGAFVFRRSTKVYSAGSVLYIQQSVPMALRDETSSYNGNSSANYLFTQCSVIQSTAILSSALEAPGVSDLKCLRGVENPVGYLKSVVVAAPSKQGDLVNISMESTDPRDASVIVNAVVQAYIDYQTKQHQNTAVQVVSILKKSADEHEAVMKEDRKKMLDIKKAHPELAFESGKEGIPVNRLNELSGKLSDAQFRALDLKTAALEAGQSAGDPIRLRNILEQCQLSAEISPSADPQLLGELHQTERNLEALSDQNLGPQNPDVISTKTRLDRLRAEVQAAQQRAIDSCVEVIKEAEQSADQHVKQLEGALADERRNTADLNVTKAEYDELDLEADRATRSLDLLESRIKDINVNNEDVGAFTVSILETAKPEWVPVRPVASKTLGTALIGGLLAGLGIALILDLLDQRLRTIEEISAILDLPVIGAVPRISLIGARGEQAREIFFRPRSAVAEAYRSIRTAIYFGPDQGQRLKSILVTSPSPGEGKSTCVANLAIAISQAGRRVLVIDADCRRPTQHKIFKVTSKKGLSTLLSGESKISELDSLILKTDIPNLELLPCGALPSNPAELLDSQLFLDLLKTLTGRYDQVMIDSPPILPVSDGRILAASCDATIMLLRAKSSTRRLALLALEALSSVGANVLGVVINDITKSGSGYDYTYYGGGRYGSTNHAAVNGKDHLEGAVVVKQNET